MFRLYDNVIGLGPISIPAGVKPPYYLKRRQVANPLAFWLRCISLFHRSCDNGTFDGLSPDHTGLPFDPQPH